MSGNKYWQKSLTQKKKAQLACWPEAGSGAAERAARQGGQGARAELGSWAGYTHIEGPGHSGEHTQEAHRAAVGAEAEQALH